MNEQLILASKKEENETSETIEELIEITTYIREDQVLALEILENARRHALGANFDRATLIREALDMLIEKHIVAMGLRRNDIVERP
jgi:hypothetical protein